MKVTQPSRLSREALTDAPAGEYVDRILEKINADAEQTNGALMNNLNFADNMNAAIVKYRFTHGVELKIPNPLKTRPVGMKVIRSAAINGGTRYKVANEPDWRFIDGTDPKATQQIGVTIDYAPPTGLCSLYRSAAYDVPDNANTAVPFDSTAFASGSLSYDATTTGILCASAGFVQVGYSLDIAATAAGVRRAFITRTGSVSVDIWGRETDAGTASPTGMSGSALISVSAADYLQLIVLQNSGGVLALSVAQNRVRLDAHYVSPPLIAQNEVTLLVIGG